MKTKAFIILTCNTNEKNIILMKLERQNIKRK